MKTSRCRAGHHHPRKPIGLRAVLTACLLTLAVCSSPSVARAKSVVLGPGESYSQGDLNVLCGKTKGTGIVTLTECQFWDEFNAKCLYEKKVLSHDGLECIEQCQHWDDYTNTCRFATTCVFYPNQGLFVLTRCEQFDEFQNKCLKTKQTKIIN